MLKKAGRTAILIALAALVVSCAAGKKHYETGMQLAEYGKNREAIAYLEQAIEAEPKNQKYKQALTELKSDLVARHAEAARSALSQEPLTVGALDQAKLELAKAQEIDAGDPQVKALADDVSARQEAFMAGVKAAYATAEQAIGNSDWSKAYFALSQVQASFPNYENTSQLIAKVKQQGGKAYFDEAAQAFHREDFAAAKKSLRKALALDPELTPAREMLAEAQKNDSKDYFIQQGNDARVSQDWDRAVTMYERALTYGDDPKLESLIGHVRLKAGEFYVRKARTQMEDGWLLKSVKTAALAEKYLDPSSDFMVSSLKKDIAQRASLLAESFKEEGRYGSAWFWYDRIKQLDPAYPNIFFLMQSMQDHIRQRVQKSIAVFDFGSPSDHTDAGVIVANNLITYLFRNASGDIKILERENLKSILEEMKLGQIGVVTENTAKEMGRVYGIDVAIMGSVLLYRVDSSVSKGRKSVRYQVGTEIHDNIEYLNWVARHPDPSQAELARAPQAKITVPKYAEKDYEVAEHKKVGFVQLSFRIVDVSTGENVQVRTIERRKVYEDEVSAGVPEAQIEYDALVMPTDTELTQELTEGVVAEMGQEALKPLRNLEQVYFKEGENYIRRRENLHAAEKFVDAVFDEKLKGVHTPITERSLARLDEIFTLYRIQM